MQFSLQEIFSVFFNNFKIYFWPCWVFTVPWLFSPCGEQGLYILYIKYINVAGWLETGILSLLFWSVQITQCLFSFGCAEPFLPHVGFLWVQQAGTTLIAVLASHCCSSSCCRAHALEHRLSTCVARA